MEFFTLIKREVKEPLKPLIAFVVISGLTNGGLVAIINIAAEHASNSSINTSFFLLFIFGIIAYLLSKKYVLDRSGIILESAMCRLRDRIANKIRHTELNILEEVGTSVLYARLTQDATYISNVATTLVGATQSAFMIGFIIIYIGVISVWSFFIVIAAIVIGLAFYLNTSRSFRLVWQKVSIKEATFIENLQHILEGFKEIKINRSKNEAVFSNYQTVNKELKKYRIDTALSYNGLLIFSQSFFFILLGIILFILPNFHAEHSEDVIKVTTAIVFIIGPFEGLMSLMHFFDKANNSTRNLMNLEEHLEELLKKNNLDIDTQNEPSAYELLPYLKNIQFQNLNYSYPPTKERDHIFKVGPVNLTLHKGELIFITGGNGSGKSTFLKMLTGLYPPQSGQIVVDVDVEGQTEEPITASNYQQYRNLFTTIFTDFHLFDKLYGVENVEPAVVNRLLNNMDMPKEKVSYKKTGFTNLNLSTGQKKRLALTTSLMEDKPIYVFDEVAADLDPEFRDKFYYQLLRELKERNKTVIVVSHDRHYWTVPDRLLEMRNGYLRELSKEEITSLLALNRGETEY